MDEGFRMEDMEPFMLAADRRGGLKPHPYVVRRLRKVGPLEYLLTTRRSMKGMFPNSRFSGIPIKEFRGGVELDISVRFPPAAEPLPPVPRFAPKVEALYKREWLP